VGGIALGHDIGQPVVQAAARAHTQRVGLRDVRLDPRDIAPALRRLTERMAQQQGHATMRPGS
jgi:phage tail tape-measure protein